MKKEQLEQLVAQHGLTIDGYTQGVAKFRDLEIGVGADRTKLQTLCNQLQELGLRHANITTVTNNQHEQYGQPYLEVPSFWCE